MKWLRAGAKFEIDPHLGHKRQMQTTIVSPGHPDITVTSTGGVLAPQGGRYLTMGVHVTDGRHFGYYAYDYRTKRALVGNLEFRTENEAICYLLGR
jgi:hypothetical protein